MLMTTTMNGTTATSTTNSNIGGNEIPPLAVLCTSRGACNYQEDRTLVCTLPDESGGGRVYGVFDGHGGEKAAQYCVKHFSTVLSSQDTVQTDIPSALVSTYKRLDKKFLKKLEDSGTTAVVAVWRSGTLYVANAGDSRCILCRGTNTVPLSNDHKPADPIEKKRIKKAGHMLVVDTALVAGQRVKVDRIDGVLACARSIGDGDFKDCFGEPPESQAVSCIPDVETVPLSPADRFIVVACDGLYDVMTNEEIVDFVRNRLPDACMPTLNEAQGVVDALVDYAVEDRQSTDNTTALLVVFPTYDFETGGPTTGAPVEATNGERHEEEEEEEGGSDGGKNIGDSTTADGVDKLEEGR
eukprot:TRINITY_DN554_c0_g1_i1.p1 TRINITY_DN554_c0_g1~~TRINITY_DN554_c0_g1_i1.p1  ORF type:complete len:355 (+),score=76.98 TRINITY_DN554_c0_g1_i1:97-1161(+)